MSNQNVYPTVTNEKRISRCFHHLGASRYASSTVLDSGAIDDVYFGNYDEHGATIGELKLTWYVIGDAQVPRLEAFCDAWRALIGFQDVLAALAEHDNRNITPAEFCDLLLQMGFEDLTKHSYPASADNLSARAEKFKIAAAAVIGGSERAFRHLLNWLSGSDADDRDAAGYTLADLIDQATFDEPQLQLIHDTYSNLTRQTWSPGIRVLGARLQPEAVRI